MQGFSILAVLLCVLMAVNLSFGSRIVKRWAFFANKDENLKQIPGNCDDIVEQYTSGQLLMYEYKIKMKKCLTGQKEGAPSSIVSKYEDDSSVKFFKNAMKYVDDEGSANYEDDEDYDDDADKKSMVPATDAAMPNTVPAATDAAAANYYPGQENVQQSQAAFAQDPMANQAAPVQQNYNYYTRSNIPAAPQAPQVQQDMSQWNTPSVDATKKDTLPAAPAAADDPFANFMNIQSTQNAAPQASQQRSDIPAPVPSPQEIQQKSDIPAPVPSPQEIQQRSDIPAPVPAPQEIQQRSEIPVDAAYQAPAAPAYPSAQQAYFRDQYRAWSPEDDGIFPENP